MTTAKEETRSRLQKYGEQEGVDWSRAAAADPKLDFDMLLVVALDDLRESRRSGGEERREALIVLHRRQDDRKSEIAHRLLLSKDAVERELGARLMREFQSLDDAPSEYSAAFVAALAAAAEKETDVDALWYELSAIGWQKLAAGRPTLLAFADHEDDQVRETIANNLWLTTNFDERLPNDVMDALLTLATDRAACVRGSVLYDVAEWPEIFRHEPRWPAICDSAANGDPDQHVRKWAIKAKQTLAAGHKR